MYLFPLVLAATTACFSTSTPAGGHTTMTMSDVSGANISVESFEAGQFAASYNSATHPPDGWSSISALTTALQAMNHECKGVVIAFSGRPDLGRVIDLDLTPEDDAAGTNLTDSGKLFWQDGCITDGTLNEWRSTGGTLEITSVDEIDDSYVQAGSDPNGIDTVGFTFSDVAMAPDPESSGAATGTFTADGEGSIDLFAGLYPAE